MVKTAGLLSGFTAIAKGFSLVAVGFLVVGVTSARNTPSVSVSGIVHPFGLRASAMSAVSLGLNLDRTAYAELAAGPSQRIVRLPLPDGTETELELTRFTVVDPNAQFITADGAGGMTYSHPEVATFRGRISDDPESYAFLAITARGSANGYVSTSAGETYVIGQPAANAGRGSADGLVIQKMATGAPAPDLQEGMRFCGAESLESYQLAVAKAAQRSPQTGPVVGGMRVANVAIEGDQTYFDLFGDVTAAQDYVVQVIAAVSSVYERDVNIRLNIVRSRVWPAGGEPFGADDLDGFRNYYWADEDTTGLQLVHLLSARHDTPYGGIAFVSGTCGGEAYGITVSLGGSFPTNYMEPSLYTWDVQVIAHEMGHNFGSWHTHDYWPPIDECGNGTPGRGTLMSYCESNAGNLRNRDMRFHRRVQETFALDINPSSCHWFDCNANGIPDDQDILASTSDDVNQNGIPDECEDCNNNGVLDPDDILGGAPDIDGNGIPDECEADCNNNSWPDSWEIATYHAPDDNGNGVPDACDPDCNSNGQPDFDEIAQWPWLDYDRNNIPDECQDCDGNGGSDWEDLERQFNIFVSNSLTIQELRWTSGYPIWAYSGAGTTPINNPLDITISPDRRLYVANTGGGNVLMDPFVVVGFDAFLQIIPAGSGGLSAPTALTYGPDGRLYVASSGTFSIIKYEANGTLIGTFVSSGSGGLLTPYGLRFGPNGNLFVTSSPNNKVLEYSGSDGSFVREFVDNSGFELNGPRGLDFLPNGDLLVASYFTDNILRYDGATGAFVEVFNKDVDPVRPWDLEIGPNGNVFVVRTDPGATRVYEYELDGHYQMARVRGLDAGIDDPKGLAFCPASQFDCNGNDQLDQCDIALGVSIDFNSNGLPDECECLCPLQADLDSDGFLTALDLGDEIDILFAGKTDPKDPGCPTSRADFDCDGFSTALDLGNLIDHLFAGAAGPCNPCGP